MFSGLVAETGRIVKITQNGETIELVVEPHRDDFLTTVQLGD